MDPTRPLLVLGTRPEAIKMAPVVRRCEESPAVEPIVCFTGQHREMLQQVTDYFGIDPDVDLELMRPDQTLSGLTARCVEGLDATIERFDPTCLVAQGDTATVMAASVVAFFRKLPFVHVEAGLRTDNLYSPWPEEFNRRVISLGTALHCAPTKRSAQNLIEEGIAPHRVHVTGNTVIDALLETVAKEKARDERWRAKHAYLGEARLVLITGHRRENLDGGFESICEAVGTLAENFADVRFVYPVHLNPNVREPVYRLLGDRRNIHLIEPVPYPEFVWLMNRSAIILTDSGGVQEEAPSLRKPVVVMRDTTERVEAAEAGAVRIVGAATDAIVAAVSRLLTDETAYRACQIDVNPYGEGDAAQKIVRLIEAAAWDHPGN